MEAVAAVDVELVKVTDSLWEMPPTGGMRVPARIYSSESMLHDILEDRAYRQRTSRTCPVS